MLALESVLITCIINDYEGVYITITVVPGAYLGTKIYKEALVVLHGYLTKLITLIDPNFRVHVKSHLMKFHAGYRHVTPQKHWNE